MTTGRATGAAPDASNGTTERPPIDLKEIDPRSLGEVVTRLRQKKGWLQADLAKKMEVDHTFVSHVESGTGRKGLSLRTMYKLCGAFDLPLAALVLYVTQEWKTGDKRLDELQAALREEFQAAYLADPDP